MNRQPQKFLLLACAVFEHECHYCIEKSNNIIDLRIIDQSLHDVGEHKMSTALQQEIDAADQSQYDAILLAYGLCNNGIRGLHADIPVVVPRAHDCITLLMGSKERYQRYFNENPGTYYNSVGWIENSKSHFENPHSTTSALGLATYHEYVEKYGEENAKYLMETMGDWLQHYSKLAYIDTHVSKNSEKYIQESRATAAENGWQFEVVDGNLELILKLVNGIWNKDEFLVLPPGKTIAPTGDDMIVAAADNHG